MCQKIKMKSHLRLRTGKAPWKLGVRASSEVVPAARDQILTAPGPQHRTLSPLVYFTTDEADRWRGHLIPRPACRPASQRQMGPEPELTMDDQSLPFQLARPGPHPHHGSQIITTLARFTSVTHLRGQEEEEVETEALTWKRGPMYTEMFVWHR